LTIENAEKIVVKKLKIGYFLRFIHRYSNRRILIRWNDSYPHEQCG